MKLYEIARQAIATHNPRLAHSLAERLTVRHGLNHEGMREYLAAHDVDPADFEEVLKEA